MWLDGCSGCHMSFLDLDERILVLARPPHRAPVIVENPLAGQAGYRSQAAFLDKCNELRRLLG